MHIEKQGLVCLSLLGALFFTSPADAFMYHGQEREITDEVTVQTGDCFFMKVPKVLYETSNHDVCELLLSNDTEPTKFYLPNRGKRSLLVPYSMKMVR